MRRDTRPDISANGISVWSRNTGPRHRDSTSPFTPSPARGLLGEYFSPYRVFPPGAEKPKLIDGRRTFTGTITDGPEGEYITDRLTDEALKFIEANKHRRFYVNLWHYAVHGPWGHKEEYTKKFAKKEDPTGRQGNPIMASMLRSVDESLGRVLAKLDELGLTDNTIFIFYSDNGGNVVSNTGEKLREMESRKLSPAFEDMLVGLEKMGRRSATDQQRSAARRERKPLRRR